MILFEGTRESKSWLITSTLLAHPDPFLPLSLPSSTAPLHTHILAIFPSLNNTSQVVDGRNIHVFKDAGGDTCTCACISRQTGRSSVGFKNAGLLI